MSSFYNLRFLSDITLMYYSVQIKKYKMNRACSTHAGNDKRTQSLFRNTAGKRDHVQDLGVAGRIILKWNEMKETCGGVEWINVAEDMGQW
jgi:hypothetical protein